MPRYGTFAPGVSQSHKIFSSRPFYLDLGNSMTGQDQRNGLCNYNMHIHIRPFAYAHVQSGMHLRS